MGNLLQLLIYTSRSYGHFVNLSPLFTLLLARVWSPPTPEGNTWLVSSLMHHYVYQQVVNCVCLSFGVKWYRVQWVFRACWGWKWPFECGESELVNNKAMRRATKLFINARRGAADSGDSLYIHLYKRLSHCFHTVIVKYQIQPL